MNNENDAKFDQILDDHLDTIELPEFKTEEATPIENEPKENEKVEIKKEEVEKPQQESHQEESPPPWVERKNHYKLLAQKEALVAENAKLKEVLDQSLKSGAYHHEKNIYTDLEMAKVAFRNAYVEGDDEKAADTQVLIAQIVAEINRVKDWQTKEERRKTQEEENKQQLEIEQTVIQEKLQDFFEDNPVIRKGSRHFNPKIAEEVVNYSRNLDNALRKEGNEHLILSDQYFDAINNYIDKVKTENTSKREPQPVVGGVTRSGSTLNGSSNNHTPKVTLTQHDKDIIERFGWTEESYIPYKIKAQTETLKRK